MEVCKLWRDVAINCPPLWSFLDITYDSPLSALKTYLERAKHAPLDINIDLTKYHSYSIARSTTASDGPSAEGQERVEWNPRDRFYKVLNLVAPHMSHTRSLRITVFCKVYMCMAFEILGRCDGAPMLEFLSLRRRCAGFCTGPHEQDYVLFSGNAPRLKYVVLRATHLDWEHSNFLCGLRSLELMDLDAQFSPSFQTFSRIAQDSPDLEYLYYVDSELSWDSSGGLLERQRADGGGMNTRKCQSSNSIVTLSSVKKLILSHSRNSLFVRDLFSRTAFPRLTSLTLSLRWDDTSDVLCELATPHHTAKTSVLGNLETMHLACIAGFQKPVVGMVMASMKRIKTLRLNFHQIHSDWYEVLIPVETPDEPGGYGMPYFPQMETLHCDGLSGGNLMRLVKARTAARVPLTSLYVSNADLREMDEDHRDWLEKESGLETFQAMDLTLRT